MTIDGPMTPVVPTAQSLRPVSRPVDANPVVTPTQAAGPAGVTPELWNSLSVEEQSFFAQSSLRGPLTYGPTETGATDQAALRGQRVDVRA